MGFLKYKQPRKLILGYVSIIPTKQTNVKKLYRILMHQQLAWFYTSLLFKCSTKM